MPRRRRHLARSLCTRFFLINYAAWRLCRILIVPWHGHCWPLSSFRSFEPSWWFWFFFLKKISIFVFRFLGPKEKNYHLRLKFFSVSLMNYYWSRGKRNYWLYWFLFHIRIFVYWNKIPKLWKNDSQNRDSTGENWSTVNEKIIKWNKKERIDWINL